MDIQQHRVVREILENGTRVYGSAPTPRDQLLARVDRLDWRKVLAGAYGAVTEPGEPQDAMDVDKPVASTSATNTPLERERRLTAGAVPDPLLREMHQHLTHAFSEVTVMLDVITNMQNVAIYLREQRNQEQQRLSAIQSSTHSRKRGEAGATASAALPPLHPPPQDQWLMVTETAAPEVEEEHANVDRRCRIGTRLLQWQRATQLFNTNITALRAIAGSEQVFFEQAVPQLQARGWTFHARVDALRQAHDLAIDYGHGKEAIFRRDVRLLVKADGTETVQPRSRLIIAKEYLTGARLHAEIRSRPSFDEVFHCQSVPVDFGEGVAQDTGGSVTEESHCNDDKNDGDDDDDDDEQRAEHDHRRLSMARDTLADMELFAVLKAEARYDRRLRGADVRENDITVPIDATQTMVLHFGHQREEKGQSKAPSTSQLCAELVIHKLRERYRHRRLDHRKSVIRRLFPVDFQLLGSDATSTARLPTAHLLLRAAVDELLFWKWARAVRTTVDCWLTTTVRMVSVEKEVELDAEQLRFNVKLLSKGMAVSLIVVSGTAGAILTTITTGQRIAFHTVDALPQLLSNMLADSRRTLEASVKVRPDDAVVEVYRETPVAHTISSDGYLLAERELVEVKQTEGESWWASDVIRTLRQSTPNEIGGQQRVDVRQVPPVLIDF